MHLVHLILCSKLFDRLKVKPRLIGCTYGMPPSAMQFALKDVTYIECFEGRTLQDTEPHLSASTKVHDSVNRSSSLIYLERPVYVWPIIPVVRSTMMLLVTYLR